MKFTAKALLAGFAMIGLTTLVQAQDTTTDWREEFAYMMGKQAYIYGFPGLNFSEIRDKWVNGEKSAFSSKVNAYTHYRKLVDPSYQYGTSMNRDTLYSIAFGHLDDEPLIFTAPANTDDRYFTIEFTEWYTDALGYISKRTVGNKAAAYLVHKAGWEGVIPAGIDGILESPTPWIVAVARTYTTNTPEDLKLANAMQDNYKIYPLSEWGKKDPQEATPIDHAPRAFPATDPLGRIKTLDATLRENPPPARDAALVKQFGLVGIGPMANSKLTDMDAATLRGLARAGKDAQAYLQRVAEAVGSITNKNKVVNGWKYNPSNWCRMAEDGDFLGRAATQSLSGGLENCIEEAVKLRIFTEQTGDNLNGNNRYVLKFNKDQIPRVDAFWSITLYDNHFNLVQTDSQKFAVRDIDSDIVYGDDGSLTIYLQSEKPDEANVNWLPTPKDMDFNLFFRAYLPDQSLIDQTYIPPTIRKRDR